MMGTGGSTSVLSEWKRLRKAGACARVMLLEAAAEIWKVDPGSCRAEKSFVLHDPTHRRLSYGELAEKASQMFPPRDVFLKDERDFKVIGKSLMRLIHPEKRAVKRFLGST